MRKRLYAMGALLLLTSLTAVSQDSKPAAGNQSRTLQVQLDYTGSGQVDQGHKIYVVLWDSPEFMQGQAMPVSMMPATAKDATVTFADVQKVPAYVSAAFDTSGKWDGTSGPPPSGTSLGLYSKTPGTPEPIDVGAGKTVKVKLPFDDSIKMP